MGYMFNILVLVAFLHSVQSQRCPTRWLEADGDSCYKFWPTVLKTWHKARETCLRSDGDLLKLDSKAEKDWIINKIKTYPVDFEWWIGLTRHQANDTRWQWVDGTERNNTNPFILWGSGEPNNYRDAEDCGEVWDNLLNDKNCDQPLQFICEKPKDMPMRCDVDDGWDDITPGTCYKYFSGKRTYSDAKQECGKYSATIMTSDNDNVQAVISDYIKGDNKGSSWLNMKLETGDRSKWVWQDTVREIRSNEWWNGGIPDTDSLQGNQTFCAAMNTNTTGYNNWNPISCEANLQFMCQKPAGTCPTGYEQHKDTCYLVNEVVTNTWNEARGYCNLRGTVLLEIKKQSDMFFLKSLLKSKFDGTDTAQIWLGFSGNGSTWTWDAGDAVSNDGKVMQTEFGNTTGCGYIQTGNGVWKVDDCSAYKGIVCTVPVNTPLRSPSPLKPRYECLNGFTLVDNKCFRVMPGEPMNWMQARQECQTYGADLATILSLDEQLYLLGTIKSESWIGLNDRTVEGTYKWLDDDIEPDTKYWNSGEPNNIFIGGRYSENCVAMLYLPGRESHGQWKDLPCNFKRNFVCERRAEWNIALGKIATQSSDYRYDAYKATDTCATRSWNSECCTHTSKDVNPWWELDLGTQYAIGKVIIHRRFEEACVPCQRRMHNFRLFISNTTGIADDAVPVFQDKRPSPPGRIILPFPEVITGRYVRIDIPDRLEYLSLCEIEVFLASTMTANPMAVSKSKCYTDSKTWAGQVSHSVSGRTCQLWVLDSPHEHTRHNDARFSDGSQTKAKNYCRDPDGEGEPWCYTTDPNKRWEFCGIPECHTEIKVPTEGTDDKDGKVCEQGWEIHGDSCYYFNMMSLSWDNAQTHCASAGASLTKVQTSNEHEFLRKKCKTYPGNHYWIGARYINGVSGFRWWDHSEIEYNGWFPGQPDLTQGCVDYIVNYEFLWNDHDNCDTAIESICEKPAELKSTKTMSNSDCGNGWLENESTGLCYKVGENILTWGDAKFACENMDGTLLVPNSDEDAAHIKELLISNAIPYMGIGFWLGISVSYDDDRWKTVDKTNNIEELIKKYMQGNLQPSTSQCVSLAIDRIKNTGIWSVSKCVERKRFLCKKRGSYVKYQTSGDDTLKTIPNDLRDETSLMFEFKGVMGATVVLQNSFNDTSDKIYKIVIGGNMNTKSYIKTQDSIPPKYTSFVQKLCNEEEYRPFWVDWKDGFIKVGRGTEHGRNIFLEWSDPQYIGVKFVSVTTGNGQKGFWRFNIEAKDKTKDISSTEGRNLALGKPTYQTSSHSDFSGSDKAVDGCAKTFFTSECCTHTLKDYEPWWQVDLGRVYPIQKVVITRRTECCQERMQGFRMFISSLSDSTSSDDLVYTNSGSTPPDVVVIPTVGKSGRYVKIDIPDRKEYLELCEVQVIEDVNVPKCGIDWVDYEPDDLCFQFSQMMVSWSDARNYCKQLNSDLLLITSPEQQLFIYEYTMGLIKTSVLVNGLWLGAHDMSTDNTFETLDGRPLRYTDWGENEPNNYNGNEDCVSIRLDSSSKTGRWNDASCTSNKQFACMKNELETTTTTTTTAMTTTTSTTTAMTTSATTNTKTATSPRQPSIKPKPYPTPPLPDTTAHSNSKLPAGCPDGWHHNQAYNACYILKKEPVLEFFDAAMRCAALNARLTDISSTTEQQFIKSVIEEQFHVNGKWDGVWIGGIDKDQEAAWTWYLYDTNVSKTLQWSAGQPDNHHNNEDCTAMRLHPNFKGELNDIPCTWDGAKGYICKRMPGEVECKDKWLLDTRTKSCYKLEDRISTFSAANISCHIEEGAHLASITSIQDQQFIEAIAHLMKYQPSQMLWVGAYDFLKESDWSWSDGSPWWKGIAWAPGQPDNWKENEHCGVVYTSSKTGLLNDATCEHHLPYVCKQKAKVIDKETTKEAVTKSKPLPPVESTTSSTTTESTFSTTTRPTDDPNSRCGHDWDEAPNSDYCYKIVTEEANWWDASMNCTDSGGNLLSITSAEEQSYINGRLVGMSLSRRQHFWIGANDERDEGRWGWSDGSPIVFFNWASSEPDNYLDSYDDGYIQLYGDEDCVAMIWSDDVTNIGKWVDDPCRYTHKYICKKRARAPSTTTTTTPNPEDVTVIEIYQERRPLHTDFTTHDLYELGVRPVDTFKFSVKTKHDAHILLQKDRTDYTDNVVLVIIAGWGNTKSVINWKGHAYAENNDNGLLTESEYRPFWISWSNNKVLVGRSDKVGEDVVLSWNAMPFDIRFVSVGTAQGTDAYWRLLKSNKYYGCSGKGWLPYRKSCYLLVQQQKSWDDASKYCRLQGGELTSISDQYEQSFLFSQIPRDNYCFNKWKNDTECQKWSEWGECDKNPVWMATHCHEACKHCMHNCRDTYSAAYSGADCMDWAKIGECDKNPKFMVHNCAQSCGICQGAPTRGFWIGLRSNTIQHEYSWSDTSKITYTSWDENEPNGFGKKDSCIAMFLQNGKWNDGPCEDPLSGFICEQPKLIMPETTQSSFEIGCSGDNSYGYGTFCYTYVSEQMSWTKAMEYCNNAGGHLVHIDDRYVQAFVASELVNLLQDHWTGLLISNKTVMWEDHHDVKFTHFQRGFFASKSDDGCFAMTTYKPAGLWKYYDCKTALPFVCQSSRIGFTMAVTTPTTTTPLPDCPSPWLQFNGFCYRISPEKETRYFESAKQTCAEFGASLVSIINSNENSFLRQNLIFEKYWIGLHDSSTEGSFVWDDGSAFIYSNWLRTEPNNSHGLEDCTEIARNGLWNDITCHAALPFICKIPQGKRIVDVPAPDVYKTCNGTSDWKLLDDSCYFLSGSLKRNWNNARRYCKENGAELASIHSVKEQHFLTGLGTSIRELVWIGLTNLNAEASYRWSDSSALNYESWKPGEPNNGNGQLIENCAALHGTNGLWKDLNCLKVQPFLCMRPKDTVVPPATTPVSVINGGCQTGFKPFGNKCYFVGGLDDKFGLSRDIANSACKIQNSHLVSIHSAHEQAFITTLLLNQSTGFWIGLSLQNDAFAWDDYSAFDFANWNIGEPSSISTNVYLKEPCAEMLTSEPGKWNDVHCNAERGYICANLKQTSFPTPTPATQDQRCKTGYTLYGQSCYKVLPTLQSWNESYIMCLADGAHVVTIQNAYEEAFVIVSIAPSTENIWLGATLQPNGELQVINNSTMMTRWNQPIELGDSGCTYLTIDGLHFGSCDSQFRSVCEMEIETPGTTASVTTLYRSCRESWLRFDGDCYLIDLTNQTTFSEALRQCEGHGAHLVSIHSREENRALAGMILSKINKQGSGVLTPWLGLFRYRYSTDFYLSRWTDNSILDFTHFTTMQRKAYDYSCVTLSPYNTNWYDTRCLERHGYICKTKPDITTTTRLLTTTTSLNVISDNTTTNTTPVSQAQNTKPFIIPPFHHPVKSDIDIPDDETLTAGQIVGLIIGILGGLVILGALVYTVWSTRMKKSMYMVDKFPLGFDNALFNRNTESVSIE